MQRNLECLHVGTGDPTRLPLPTAHREQLVPGALEHYDLWNLGTSWLMKGETWGIIVYKAPIEIRNNFFKTLAPMWHSQRKQDRRKKSNQKSHDSCCSHLSVHEHRRILQDSPASTDHMHAILPLCQRNIPIKKMKRRNWPEMQVREATPRNPRSPVDPTAQGMHMHQLLMCIHWGRSWHPMEVLPTRSSSVSSFLGNFFKFRMYR